MANDPLSSTDTWAPPTLNTAILAQPGTRRTPPWSRLHPRRRRRMLAAKIEAELKSLASNLTELETRLAAKGERLAIIERNWPSRAPPGRRPPSARVRWPMSSPAAAPRLPPPPRRSKALQDTRFCERDAALQRAPRRARDRARRRRRRLPPAAPPNWSPVMRRRSAPPGSRSRSCRRKAPRTLETLQSMEGRRGIFDSMLRSLDLQIAGREQDQARLSEDLARNASQGLELTRELEARSCR